MDDNFFEYLYVTGELNKDDSLGNSNINELYNQYYSLFPNDPIDNEFFFNSQEEQIRLLEEAINNGEPIKKRGK
jgi:hypothetical protein